jgi:hypothetical protein
MEAGWLNFVHLIGSKRELKIKRSMAGMQPHCSISLVTPPQPSPWRGGGRLVENQYSSYAELAVIKTFMQIIKLKPIHSGGITPSPPRGGPGWGHQMKPSNADLPTKLYF